MKLFTSLVSHNWDIKYVCCCGLYAILCAGNWALIYAQQLAKRHCLPLMVCFCLVPKFLEATIRQYGFMLKGLQEVEQVIIINSTSKVTVIFADTYFILQFYLKTVIIYAY